MSGRSAAASQFGARMSPADPVGDPLWEIPLPPHVTGEDVQFAVRAVVVHAPESWPAGPRCRNDGARHPCRLHRWGSRVLTRYGLSAADIDALVSRGDPMAAVRLAGGDR